MKKYYIKFLFLFHISVKLIIYNNSVNRNVKNSIIFFAKIYFTYSFIYSFYYYFVSMLKYYILYLYRILYFCNCKFTFLKIFIKKNKLKIKN